MEYHSLEYVSATNLLFTFDNTVNFDKPVTFSIIPFYLFFNYFLLDKIVIDDSVVFQRPLNVGNHIFKGILGKTLFLTSHGFTVVLNAYIGLKQNTCIF